MTFAIYCPDCPRPWKETGSHGVSPESSRIAKEVNDSFKHDLQLARDTYSSRYWSAGAKLKNISEECRTNDWDGRGATAVPIEATEEALDLITQIPLRYPMPEIYPEEGEITLEWHVGRYKKLLLSVRGDGFVYYNGLFGFKNADSGSKNIRGKLDPEIIGHLDKLYP